MSKFTNAAAQIIENWNAENPDNRWLPACGGLEKPFVARGIRWIYCYNKFLGVHRYLNLNEDRIVEDAEYNAIVWGA